MAVDNKATRIAYDLAFYMSSGPRRIKEDDILTVMELFSAYKDYLSDIFDLYRANAVKGLKV